MTRGSKDAGDRVSATPVRTSAEPEHITKPLRRLRLSPYRERACDAVYMSQFFSRLATTVLAHSQLWFSSTAATT
jgi:hypothetical protein